MPASSRCLNAEQAYQQARIALVQAQANRYADTAALFQALGGGWWHRTDLAKDDHDNERSAAHRQALAGRSRCHGGTGRSPAAHPKPIHRPHRTTPSNVTLTPASGSISTSTPWRRPRFHKTIEATGVVDFDNDQATSVLAPFSGPVSRLLVSPGDKVRQGAAAGDRRFARFCRGRRRLSQGACHGAERATACRSGQGPARAQRRFAARSRASRNRCRRRRSRPRCRAADTDRR